MSKAPHERTLGLAGHFFPASPLGSPAKPVGRAAGARVESSPNAPRSSPLPPALLPRPRRAPPEPGRRAVRVSGRRPRWPALATAPRAVPQHPVFATCSERGGLQRPHRQAANFVPCGAGAILAKFVRPSPLPTCAGEAPARAAQALGPPGAARSPGRTGEFATVARAPRRPSGASASPLGGRGLGAPGRGRARGPRLPAVAPGHYRRPVRALRGRSARALRRGAGDN